MSPKANAAIRKIYMYCKNLEEAYFYFLISHLLYDLTSLCALNFVHSRGHNYTVFRRINAPGAETENGPLPLSDCDETQGADP